MYTLANKNLNPVFLIERILKYKINWSDFSQD